MALKQALAISFILTPPGIIIGPFVSEAKGRAEKTHSLLKVNHTGALGGAKVQVLATCLLCNHQWLCCESPFVFMKQHLVWDWLALSKPQSWPLWGKGHHPSGSCGIWHSTYILLWSFPIDQCIWHYCKHTDMQLTEQVHMVAVQILIALALC